MAWHAKACSRYLTIQCPVCLVLNAVLRIERQLHGLHMHSADPSASSFPIVDFSGCFMRQHFPGIVLYSHPPLLERLSMLCIKALLLSLISGRTIRCLCHLLLHLISLLVYGPTHAFMQACR